MRPPAAPPDGNGPPADVVRALRERQRFLLASHARPDGDSIGSQLALAEALAGLGKTVRIVNHDAPPENLRWLPGAERITVADAAAGDWDAAVILECSTLDRTEVAGLDRRYLINIDHHTGNGMYGALNWFDPTAAACAEMVHDLVGALGAPLTPTLATALYAGILTDTGSFRHANITRRTFDICRRVAACGVDVAAVAADIFQRSSVGRLKLTGVLLADMRLEADGRVALLHVDEALLQRTGCPPDDLDGLVNLPLEARAVQAAVLIKTVGGVTRVSLRSKGAVDVRGVAAAFGGGGHPNAAGCTLEGGATANGVLAAVAAAVESAAAAPPPAA